MPSNTVALWKDTHVVSQWFGNTFPQLKTNRGLSLSPLSFDCSYSIFTYMVFKIFCFLQIKYDGCPGRAVNRRCKDIARMYFKGKVNGITESGLAQVPSHYIFLFPSGQSPPLIPCWLFRPLILKCSLSPSVRFLWIKKSHTA